MKPFLFEPILEKDSGNLNITNAPAGNTGSSGNAQVISATNDAATKAKEMSNNTPDNEKGNATLEKKRQILTKIAGLYSNLYQVKYQTVEEMISGYMKVIKAHVSGYIKVGTNKEG